VAEIFFSVYTPQIQPLAKLSHHVPLYYTTITSLKVEINLNYFTLGSYLYVSTSRDGYDFDEDISRCPITESDSLS
jgi:hypothetical protein